MKYVPDWNFGFDRAVRRLGCTHYCDKRITLSSSFVSFNTWEEVRLTVLHEIAHALVGFAHHHDWVWKKKCLEIGGDGKRCADIRDRGIKVDTSKYSYKAICPVCHEEHFRVRKPRKLHSCGACSKVFSKDRILVYEKITVQGKERIKEEVYGQLAFAF